MEMPPGVAGFPAGVLIQPKSFFSLEPPEPTSVSQVMPMVEDWLNRADGKFQPWMLTLESDEVSPKNGARNDVPQAPRAVMPQSSSSVQLKAILGLLVPPTSLYWS